MPILNIAGYKFIALPECKLWRAPLLTTCRALSLKGTILLSPEGININLAGEQEAVRDFITTLKNDVRFADMRFHETYSETLPFQRLKVKLKNEIITFRVNGVNALTERAPSITPATLKQWLDEKRDITLLDTRNDYEVQFGTFKGALNLHLDDFSALASSINQLHTEKPIVMFCTGGIRCEKAALFMLNKGFSHVYQLEGGILGYFANIGNHHYEGECFVFDERIALDAALTTAKTAQCKICEGPVAKTEPNLPPNVFCSACL